MKLSKIKDESINIAKSILKLGIIATITTTLNNVYKLQSNSTIQHIATDLNQLSDNK